MRGERKSPIDPPGDGGREPTLDEVAAALASCAGPTGALPARVGARLAAERRWGGRLAEVLAILTEDSERLGYLVGGSQAVGVLAWLPAWTDSPLSPTEIRAVVAGGGWDPEPFAAVAAHGLLAPLLALPDGSARRVRGELAGAWLSDLFALAESDDEVVAAVRELLEGVLA